MNPIWLKRVRPLIYILVLLKVAGLYLLIDHLYAGSTLQTIRLTQAYALLAVALLYLTLLISPLYAAFPRLPGKVYAVKARQALGVSAFGVGLLHGTIAFTGLLGGIAGLGFLSSSYLIAIGISSTALLILAILALTSLPSIHRRLGKWWKRIHRLVYVAGLLILTHALLLGTHFSDLSKAIPQAMLMAVILLMVLELLRLDTYLRHRYDWLPKYGPAFVVGVGGLAIVGFYLFAPAGLATSLGIHSVHIQLAQQAASGQNQTSTIPGLTGDRTKRYNVQLTQPEAIEPNQTVQLHFTVSDAANGNPVNTFQTLYEKTSHLIVVDSQLEYFNHIHPTLKAPTFSQDLQFPHAGVYHVYLDFQPFGAIEQQFGFTVKVGDGQMVAANWTPDTDLTKVFGSTEVTLKTTGQLRATQMTYGQQQLTFTLRDAQTHQPLHNLQPYLGAYGHLVMINQQTYDYLHVHPYALATAGNNGGPDVTFVPIGIYGPIKPGIYRVFAQFNPGGQLFTADYTVEVK